MFFPGDGQFVFDEWRKDPDLELNRPEAEDARILVAGRNFCCGSSREHAPWGLQDYGFDVIIASNSLHATRDLVRTLANVQQLLASNGLLYTTEDDQVVVRDLDSKVALRWGSSGAACGQFDVPMGIAAVGHQWLVCDCGNNRIQVFTPHGQFIGQLDVTRPRHVDCTDRDLLVSRISGVSGVVRDWKSLL